MKHPWGLLIPVVLVFLFFFPAEVQAEEETTTQYGDLSEFDFTEIEDVFDSLSDSEFDFSDAVDAFLKGDTDGSMVILGSVLEESLIGELKAEKEIIVKLLIVGLILALISKISGTLLLSSSSQTGFYVGYMIIMSLLCAGYAYMATVVTETLQNLLELMEAVVPVYILAVGFCSGTASAGAFYQVFSIVITLIEKMLIDVVIPCTNMYMIAGSLNNITEGGFFTKVCELLKTVIEWILKGLMAFVVGLNLIQGMINPVVDSIKTSSLGKTVSMIPGVGNVLSSMSEVILASGTLIKNAIGLSSMTALIVCAMLPIVKSIVISLSYKVSAAVLEPVSDKRVTGAINHIYESVNLLTKILLYAIVFFILTIAMICYSTNFKTG